MDAIILKGLQFYAYHGVLPEETVTGQKFEVDVRMELDLELAGKTDAVRNTVDYGHVYRVVKQVIEGKSMRLIESVAYHIIDQIFETFSPIQKLTVEVYKPSAPIPGIFDKVSVYFCRTRQEWEEAKMC